MPQPTLEDTKKMKLNFIHDRQKTEEIVTPISQFNKKQLCDYIIENGEYATQELLKIAVSYRFAYSHYEGNPEVKKFFLCRCCQW